METKRRLVAIGEVIADLQQEFTNVYHVQYGDEKFQVVADGLRQWTKVAFTLCGKEFYKLTRMVSSAIKDEHSQRKEYFHGKLVRKYIGNQKCFVEFCEFMERDEIKPKSMRQKILLAADALRLSMEIAKLYGLFYKRFF